MHRLSGICVGVVLTAFACFGQHGANAVEGIRISNPEGGEVRGLVIGIDAYQHVRQLKGAVADARDIQSTLKEVGVRDVTTLIDEQAERTAFLREIGALAEIRHERSDRAPCLVRQACGDLSKSGLVASDQDQVVAAFCETFGVHSPDASGGAGDHGSALRMTHGSSPSLVTSPSD